MINYKSISLSMVHLQPQRTQEKDIATRYSLTNMRRLYLIYADLSLLTLGIDLSFQWRKGIRRDSLAQ